MPDAFADDIVALRRGPLTLHRITVGNADAVRGRLRRQPDADEIVQEFDRSYLPRRDWAKLYDPDEIEALRSPA